MSHNALETLRLIFQDQPDLLKIIELGDIESRELVHTFRKNNELFATPINLYVTGRTGAGKTSLRNCLLEKVDIMDIVQFLCYLHLLML